MEKKDPNMRFEYSQWTPVGESHLSAVELHLPHIQPWDRDCEIETVGIFLGQRRLPEIPVTPNNAM